MADVFDFELHEANKDEDDDNILDDVRNHYLRFSLEKKEKKNHSQKCVLACLALSPRGPTLSFN